jgi:hypothetical protein
MGAELRNLSEASCFGRYRHGGKRICGSPNEREQRLRQNRRCAGGVIHDPPLNGRAWTLLAALEPGVHMIEAQTAIAAGSNRREDRGGGRDGSRRRPSSAEQLQVGRGRPAVDPEVSFSSIATKDIDDA